MDDHGKLPIGAMDEDKKWAISYTYHDRDDVFHVEVIPEEAPTIGQAVLLACEELNRMFEENHWSDFLVTNANIVMEVH